MHTPQPPASATADLLRLVLSLNAEANTIGAGMLAQLQALATRATLESTSAAADLQALANLGGGNTHLPESLRTFAVSRFCAPRTHQSIEIHGVTVLDHTVVAPGWDAAGAPRRDVIWLGLDLEGRALQAKQALELADALHLVAIAQLKRLTGQEGGAA